MNHHWYAVKEKATSETGNDENKAIDLQWLVDAHIYNA